MKKVYAKLAGGKLNFFRPFYKASFVKMLSLSSIVALLSSASPVYSKTVAPKEAFLISAKSPSVAFPQSVISVYDDYNVDASDQENYVTALQAGSTLAASAVSDYVNFLINTLSKKNNDNAIVNVLTAYSGFTREGMQDTLRVGNVARLRTSKTFVKEDFREEQKISSNISPLRFILVNEMQRNVRAAGGISLGDTAQTSGVTTIAIGNRVPYNCTGQTCYYHAALALGKEGIAIGSVSVARYERSTALGYAAGAESQYGTAIGSFSEVTANGGVALGYASKSNIAAGSIGYDPETGQKSEQSDYVWKSTQGAASVGNIKSSYTRQIVGVAAGTQDTDAVNVAQLKKLKIFAKKGWTLSVGGADPTNVGMGNEVDFSAGSNNLTIAKGDKDNKVTFDLAKSLTVDSIKIGENTLDATGLVIKSGPKMTTTGIDAGNKKITGVEKGTGETDAVNFAQLEEIKEQVASSSFVKQDAQTKDITIGKGTDGNKISIANKDGKGRVISGIANGAISDASTEAMTGQQLHQFGTSIAGYFGGGAKYENGQWSTPKFKVKTVKDDGTESEQSYENVASAFEGVSNSITKIQNNITKEINNVVTKVEGDSLSWSKTDDAFVAKHGAEDAKTNSKIRFLANGDVSKDSQDAINGSQLYSLGDTFAMYLGGGASFSGGTWTAPEFKVKTVKADGTEGEETVYKNVAAAFEGVGNSITDIHKEIKNEITNAVTNVKGDSLLWSDQVNAFVARHEKSTEEGKSVRIQENSKITFLANGDISPTSTDAVTGKQLYSLGDKVATYFGGDAKYENGEWTAPTFKVKTVNGDGTEGEETVYNDVASALAGVGNSFTNIKNEITNVVTKVEGDSLSWSKDDDAFVARHVEKGAGEDPVKPVNSKIKFLVNGDVSKDSQDAINGSQLFEANEKVATYLGGGAKYDEGKWTPPSFKVKTVKADGKEGKETVYKNVAAAFEGVSNSITDIHKEIKNEITNAVTNVKGDSLLWSDQVNAFVARHEKSTEEGKSVRIQENSKITFLANGDVSPTSTDAVTGKQLYLLGDTFAKYFGGGASFSGGTWTAPKFKVKTVKADGTGSEETVYNDVASALAGVGNSFTNIKNEITNVVTKVEGDSLSWSKEANAFVAHHAEKVTGEDPVKSVNSKIKFLANGDVSKGSTDAINGSQLFETNEKVATYLGGGAKYDEGKWTPPRFKVKTVKADGKEGEETVYNDVASALAGVGNSITNVKNEITKQINDEITNVKGDSLVKKDANTNYITIGAEVEGSEINIANSKNELRALSGVKEAKNDNEAVNKSQLDTSIKKVEDKLTNVTEQVKGDSLLWNEEANAFVARHEKSTEEKGRSVRIQENSKITSLLNGDVSKNSTDAINGSQLFETNDKVTTYLGGGAKYENGAWTAPSFKVKIVSADGSGVEEKVYKNVASAFGGVGDSFTSVKNSITNVKNEISKEINNVKGISLLWNDTANAFVARHEKSTEEGKSVRIQENSKITSLANGDISKTSTDAVTGKQLYSLGDKVATYFGGDAKYENGAWTAPQFKVKTVNSDGKDDEQSYDNVAAAFEGIGTSITNVQNKVTEQVNNVINKVESESFVQQDKTKNRLTIGAKTDDTEINIANKSSVDRTLSGVKAAENGNEAVNKAQFDKGLKDLSNNLQSDESAVVHYDKNNDENGTINYKSVTLGGKDKSAVALHNVADGKIAEKSHDAINGEQINKITQDIAGFFGGGAIFSGGTWIAPKFKVKTVKDDGTESEQSYNNVAAAFEGIGTSITNVQNKFTEQVNNAITKVEGENLVQQDKKTNHITIGAAKEGTEINIANKAGEKRIISGVSHGAIGKDSTQVVNGDQIHTISQDIAKFLGGNAAFNNGTLTTPTYSLSKVEENGSISSATFNDVGAAFTGLDTNIKNVNARIKEVSQGVAQDSLLWSATDGAFSARHGKEKDRKDSKITHLSDGNIASNSTDAVTGGQLYSLKSALATYFGGGAGYDQDGDWKAPSFKVNTVKNDGNSEETNYTNVADALAGVGSSFTNIKNEITKQINNEISNVKGDSLVKKDASTNYITIGAEVEGSVINITNKNKEDRLLSGVKDGELSKTSRQAVNGSQLFTTNENVTTVTNDLKKVASNTSAYFGGGADVLKGDIPSFSIQENTYHTVAEAFAGVDSSFTKLHNEISKNNTEVTERIEQNALLWNDDAHAFVARHEKSKEEGKSVRIQENSKITSLANGDISKTSTDAVTGNQLYSLGDKVATYFGGDAKYENGAWTAPTFTVQKFDDKGNATEEKYSTVTDALSGVSTSITNVKNEITKQINNEISNVKGDSLVKQDAKTQVVNIGKEVEGNTISVVNKNGEDRTLSGVQEATKGNEAVNKAQLDKSLQDLSTNLQSDDSAVVHYDKNNDENGTINYKSVTLGGKDKFPVALHNVADGVISSESHDVVNGGQLNTISQDVAKFLGGDAAFSNGSFTEPIYNLSQVTKDGEIKSAEFKNVGSAFEGLDENIKNVNQRIKEVTQGVAQDSLNWSKEEEAFVAKHGEGKNRGNSKLKFLLDGEISKGSTEAITGSQLYSMGETVATYFGGGAGYEKGKWKAPSFVIKKIDAEGKESEESYTNVAEALSGISNTVTNVHNDVTNVVSDSLIKQDQKGLITVGAERGGNKISILNRDGADRTLSGVKAAENDNEAVNKAQLDKSLKELSRDIQSEDSSVVLYDKKADGKTDYSSVTFGKGVDKDSAPVALHNVKDGVISEASHDVINGSQINTITQEVAKFFGGGAGFKDGKFTEPSYKLSRIDADGQITDDSFNDVSSAFTDLDKNIKNVNKRIKEVSEGVAQDSLNWSKEANAFVAQHGKEGAKTNSKITSLANGDLLSTSTDAVNGSQLFETNNKVSTYLGGGAKYENGQWTAPNFVVKKFGVEGHVTEENYNTVADAFSAVNGSFTKLHNEISKNNTEVTERIEQNALLWNDDAHAFVARHEKSKEEKGRAVRTQENSKIKFLADGAIEEGSTEAITGNQLYSLNKTVAKYFGGGAGYESREWTAPSFIVQKFDAKGNVTEEKYSTVADALAGVSTSITNVHKEFNNEINNVVSDSLVKKDDKINLINIGKEVEGSEINITNKNKEDRTLSGVKEAVNNNEAVNKAQFDKGLKDLSKDLQSDDSAVVHYDKKDDKIDYTNVTLGGKDKSSVALHNVADGRIGENSHDAINGKQINKISEDVAKFLGGNTSFKDGTFRGPMYEVSSVSENGEIKKTSYDNVGSAFAGLDTNVNNVNNHLMNAVQKFDEKINNITQEVQGDALLWSDADKAFIAQHGKDETRSNSKITSLRSGNIADNSTDAINGSQLYSMSNTLAKYLGGGAGYAEGQWTVPNFTVQKFDTEGNATEEKYNTVADAFSAVNNSFTNIHNEVKNEINNVISDSLVKWDDATKLIRIGGEKDGTTISIADKDNKSRTLSGVKDAENDNEAVNKGQLKKSLKKLSENIQSEDSSVVLYDKKANNETDYSSVTFGKGTDKNSAPVALHNVKDGSLSEGSHDAINGKQINKIGEDVTKFLGGNAAFKNGAFTGPTYNLSQVSKEGKVEENVFNDVGSAFAGLDENIKNVNQRIKDVSESVAQDSLNWSKEDKAFAAKHGKEGSNSKIKFLADGEIANGSTDAVNGSQLYSLNNTVAAYFGGGAEYKDGKWIAPSFKLKTINSDGTSGEEKSYDNVAAAFADVSSSFTNIKNDITNVVSESLVKQDKKTKVIAIGGEKDGTSISLANSDGADRTLSGVKAAEKDNEAVNKGQLEKSLKDLSKDLQSDDSAVVHYDKNEKGSINYENVTFGKGKGSAAVGLHNVADGLIAQGSHDVINGNQINTLSQDVAKFLGGGASFKDGSFTQPTYELSSVSEDGQVSKSVFNDVGSAFSGLGASVKNVNNHLTNVVQNFDEKITNITQEIQGDALLWSDADKAFVAKHGKDDARSNSKITFLQAGTVSENSTDAVNGSQLYSLNNTVATYFGGGAKYEEGKWVAPTFTVKTFDANGKEGEKNYTSVAEAFTGVNNAFISFGDKVTNEITNQVNNAITKVEGESLVKQDKDSKVIAIGGEKDGTSISITNIDGAARTLSGVKDGALSAVSMEAINGSQLYLMSNQLAAYFGGGAGYKDGAWRAPEFKVAQFSFDGSSAEKKSYNDVASAFEGVNGSMSSINDRINTVEQNVSSNSLNWDENEGAYNAGHAGQDSKITHVADGKVASGSKDAVNGGQLFETNERVSAVESQVSSIDKQVKDIESTVTNGVVKYDQDGEGHKVNKVTLVGVNESDPVLIDNVGDGKIESGSKEAVNGGQLHDYTEQQMKIVLDDAKKYTDDKVDSAINNAADEAKSYTDMKFETLSYAVEDVRKEARQSAAIGLAVSNLRYYDTPGSLSVSFGSGVWRSQSAFALGAGYTSEDGNIRSNVSVTSAGGHWGVGAGVTLRLR
ncbi:Vomp family autotransporter [Bartonella taylorii]|uniref:Vomp family autotransporter n=1 Tax=Bartonella taylorii TaxID=33046 RepID=UPI001ABB330D|nr:Vomp family autotransporter [Bartonella taylorii]